MISRGFQSVLQLGITIILARLLAPNDFGLMAIILALTSFAPMLIDLGLGDAAVQRAKITQGQVSALFWINVGLGAVITLLLNLLAPLIAAAYSQPELESIVRVYSVSFLLNSLGMQHLALLKRNMRFKQVAIIEISALALAAGAAIPIAVGGAGYWALAIRPVLWGLLTTTGAWICCPWRPGSLRLVSDLKSLLGFGMNVSVGALFVILGNALDRALLGLIYSPYLVGLYQNALVMYENAIGAIFAPLTSVGIAGLSKLQDDAVQFQKSFTSALASITFFSMPAFVVLSVVAPALIPFLFGEKWTGAGTILSILALRGVFHPIESSQMWLHLPLGRTDRFLRWGFITAAMQMLAIAIALPFGVIGVAYSIVITRSFLAFPAVLYAGRPLNLQFSSLWGAVGKQLIGAIIALITGKVLVHFLGGYMGWREAILCGGCGALGVYALLVVGLFRITRPLALLGSSISHRFPVPWRRPSEVLTPKVTQ